MCTCPHCHGPTAKEATYCSDCGTLLDGTRRITIRPITLPAATGPTVRLVRQQASSSALRRGRTARTPPLDPWRDLAVPLVAWVFVVTVVLGVAAALEVVGTTPGGLALVGVPVVGALLAEASWLSGRWRSGLVGMLAWDALLWMLALGAMVA